MTSEQIIKTIKEYKETHSGVKYIRVILSSEAAIPVEVDTLNQTNRDNNTWQAIAIGSSDNIPFEGSKIVRFDPW